MKKTIFTLLLCGLAYVGFGQALKVNAGGNVGIGTANPSVALEIERSAFSGLILKSTGGTSQIRMQGLVTGFIFDDQNGNLKSRFEYNNGSNQLNFFNDQQGAINFQTNSLNLHWNSQGRLGVGTNVPTHNLHVIGSAGKTVGGSVWTVLSDRRLKQNIKEYTDGLAEVLAINPITYNYNGKFGTDQSEEVVGVLAQEIQEIAPYMVKKAMLQANEKMDKEGKRSAAAESGEYLTYNANALPYMLVNAIKEQQELLEEKDARLQELTEEIGEIRQKLEKVLLAVETSSNGNEGSISKTTVEIKGFDSATLSQNRPNPFNGVTTIDYKIPINSSQAQMNFFNSNGQLLKSVPVQHKGQGELTFRATDVPSGTYSYTLVVDGNQVETKHMVFVK